MNTKPNNQKIFYIIGRDYIHNGLFSFYIWVCAQIIYAERQGYIPVVDMKHHRNQFFKDNREYRDNVWEYFFEQPYHISIDNIPEDAQIKIAGIQPPDIEHLWPGMLPLTKEDQVDYAIVDEYIKFLKPTLQMKEFLNKKYYEITNGNTNILGILVRGTDYTNLKPLEHPIQPTAEQVMEKAEELYEKFHYEKIWLATEDAIIYQKFKDKFGEKLLTNNQYKFFDTQNQYLYELNFDEKNSKFNLNRDYFLSMYILSKCKYLIGGRTSGTVAAYLLSEKFKNQEYVYLWDLGCYKKDNIKNDLFKNFSKKLLETIFSVKNTPDKKHKIIIILGIKIKIKRKNF